MCVNISTFVVEARTLNFSAGKKTKNKTTIVPKDINNGRQTHINYCKIGHKASHSALLSLWATNWRRTSWRAQEHKPNPVWGFGVSFFHSRPQADRSVTAARLQARAGLLFWKGRVRGTTDVLVWGWKRRKICEQTSSWLDAALHCDPTANRER